MVSFVTDILRELAINIAMIFSGFIGTLYDTIISLGSARIFSSEFYVEFAKKLGTVLGIFMLFRLMFSLINYMLDPDKIKDQKIGAGKMVTRVIVVIVLLASYNNLFDYLYKFQEKIINSDLIVGLFYDQDNSVIQNGGKFALQYSAILSSIHNEMDDTGYSLGSATDFIAFYRDGYESAFRWSLRFIVMKKKTDIFNVPVLGNLAADFASAFEGIKGNEMSVYYYSFDAVPCLIFVIFLAYSLFVYAIKLGVRVAQLAFMQMIAPVPIIAYMDPKSDALKKWAKILVSSYIQVFIMMIVFYFIGFFSYKMIGEDVIIINNAAFGSEWLVRLLIMCGLLILANKFPDMLKQMFNLGDTGDYGLSLKKTLAPIDPLIRRTRAEASAIGGGVAGAVGAIRAGGKGGDVAHAIWKGSIDGRKSGHFLTSLAAGFTYGRDVGAEIGTIESRLGQTISEEEIKDSMRRKARGLPTAAEEKDYEKKSYASLNDYLSQMDSISKAGFVSTFYDDNSDEYGVRTITDLMAKARIESTLGGSTESYNKLLEYSNDESSEYHDLAKKALTKENIEKLTSTDSAIFQYAEKARAEINDIHSHNYDKIVVNGEVVNDFGYLDAKSYSRTKKNSRIAKNEIELDPNQIRNVEVDKIADKRLKRSTFTAFRSSMSGKGGHGAPPPPPPRH